MNCIMRNGLLQRLPLAALAIALALAAALACGGGSGRIAFYSDRDGMEGILAIDADGSGLTRLTSFLSVYPTWSPDGERIAFLSSASSAPAEQDQSVEGSGYGIYVMNVDGSGLTRIADTRDRDVYPRWSPDGRRIVFQYNRARSRFGIRDEIRSVNADGSGLTTLTAGRYPAWSPDGERIAFYSSRSGNSEIHVMNADGSNVAQLTSHASRVHFRGAPSWSPDGRRIAFTADIVPQIYAMNADGSDISQLTNHPEGNAFPSWSPDGRRITFTSRRDGNQEIYVMNADGSDITRLTNNPYIDTTPAWTR